MTGWTEEGLLRSWRVLATQDDSANWRFVHLTDVGPVAVEAGCQFPGRREALIVSFPRAAMSMPGGLPDGKGFDVLTIREGGLFSDRTAIALVRRPEGSLDIFTVMAADVLRTLDAAPTHSPRDLAEAFIGRVSDWQTFMARKRRPLSLQAQVGLMGELWLLSQLIQHGASATAVDCWQGPLHSAQDFLIGSGAVEVKSSIVGNSFLARINSIEQLDSDGCLMFLAAVRFEEAPDGMNLVEMVERLRETLPAAGQLRLFEAMLLLSGYDEDHVEHYRVKLKLSDARFFPVEDDFPCLRRATVPAQVRKAVYTLDVDALEQLAIPVEQAFSSLGLVKHEP